MAEVNQNGEENGGGGGGSQGGRGEGSGLLRIDKQTYEWKFEEGMERPAVAVEKTAVAVLGVDNSQKSKIKCLKLIVKSQLYSRFFIVSKKKVIIG